MVKVAYDTKFEQRKKNLIQGGQKKKRLGCPN
jgi:hypothetical protein